MLENCQDAWDSSHDNSEDSKKDQSDDNKQLEDDFSKRKKIAPPWLCATKLHTHGHPCGDVMRTAMEIIHRSYEIRGGMDEIIGTYKSAKN